MGYSKKIYKFDSAGKVRVLHVYTEGADVIQKSGLLDGKHTENRSTSVSKNIGRSNETTPEEQAQSEAASKIDTKLTTGYFNSIQELQDADEVILPMLAKAFEKVKGIIWPIYGQPKLDGMRSLGKAQKGIISRKGKVIETLNHIVKDLDQAVTPYYVDGELYAHGLSFQENMKIIKKYRPGQSENVKYHVYDMVIKDLSFIERYRELIKVVDQCTQLELVPTVILHNMQELEAYHAKNLKEGYEGTILRWGHEGYAINKRSSNLVKFKDFIDIACKVVDVEPSDKRPGQGVVICELENGKRFGCGMRFSHKEREEILTNKSNYIGQTGEIRFFEWTYDGLPRFPVCVGFRLDK